MSQSPEGSAADFHCSPSAIHSPRPVRMSQSPEGSAADFHARIRHHPADLFTSQSPEGSAADFHGSCGLMIPRSVMNCLNPPKGPPPISTLSNVRLFFSLETLSQSPEGSAADSHLATWIALDDPAWMCLNPPKGPPPIPTGRHHSGDRCTIVNVSIPRRVRRRFPLSGRTC